MPAQPAGLQFIRVLVADSTRMGTQLLSDAVERDRRCKVVDSVVTSADALRAVGRQHTDIALVGTDLDHTPLRGFEAVRELRSSFPSLKSIMLLDSSREEFVVSAFRAGARGVLCRDESLNDFGKCIQCVHLGEIWANSEQLRYALDALSGVAIPQIVDAGSPLLSKREQEVVRYVAEGYSNREVAERLKLSEHTVKNYLFRIFEKLGLSSRVEVVLYAVSQREGMKIPSHAGAADRPTIVFEAPTVEWTIKAAEQGLGAAQYLLAEMYRTGNGVPTDLAQACAWFGQAEKNCATLSERSRAIRTQLALKLTAEQLSHAEGHTPSRRPQAGSVHLVVERQKAMPDQLRQCGCTRGSPNSH
jgi:DNA-binding NarL/FixJ family response regulator